MNHPTSRYFAAALLCVAAINGPQAEAAGPAYPTRPIRMVVPFPPGGATDLLARILAQRLGESLGQQVVVDNRPGAGGTLGSRLMLDAQPDGYTILMGTTSTHAIGPHLYAKPPYDPARDFAAITLVSSTPTVLLIGAALPPTSVKELIAYAKSKPGVLNYGSSGIGTQFHLSGELLKLLTGINIVHIPYKGTPEAVTDVLTGRVDYYFCPITPVLSYIREGKLLALAVGSSTRSSVLPDVPTTLEAGFPNSEYNFWTGLFAPSKTPRAVINRLYEETIKALDTPEIRERLAKLGTEPMRLTPEQFDKRIRDELAANAIAAKAAGMSAQ
jgi:tripartite-type tricarboxylate transporter receptor subunit TctC